MAVQQASRISPERTQSGPRIGYYLTMLGRYDEAAKAMKEGTENSPVIQVYRAALAVRTGRHEEAEAVLKELQWSDSANFQKAEVLAQLGRKDEAIATLSEAYEKRDSGLTTILVDPLLDPLREDPRFDAIVKRIDFPT